MANFIETTDINPRTFYTSASRYLDSVIVYYTDLKRLSIETYKRQPITLSQNDKFLVIGKGYEYRPDLISSKVYGFPDYWWRIMETNGMNDIYDFKAGVNIRVPSLL